MKSAIQVEGISKLFRLGAQRGEKYQTLRESIMAGIRAPLDRLRYLTTTDINASRSNNLFWALKDVSFEVQPGEVIGIIGQNGSGKSTLLKILSRIYEPTTGRAIVRGRLASLLEVGTGFHHELTGRENIYLNGSILGMTKKEIDRQFDEIVAFSEIEQFLDTPVKRYSSGMYVRLAFAVAAHLQPEILIVDEVLAVGDALFQKKCLGKMSDVANSGRTVLFVSHNMQAVQNLCKQVIWLSDSRVVCIGETSEIIQKYLKYNDNTQRNQTWTEPNHAPGNELILLHKITATPTNEQPTNEITTNTELKVTIDYWNRKPNTFLNLSVHVYYGDGTMAFNTVSTTDPFWHGKSFPVGLFRSEFLIPAYLLNQGIYRLEILFVKNSSEIVLKIPDALFIDVKDESRQLGQWMGRYPGVVHPKLTWSTTQIK
jgi:lipopolysaccharide transport system ATP-binding protein